MRRYLFYAAVLIVVPFLYSLHGIQSWELSAVAGLEAPGHPGGMGDTVAPLELELLRPDGGVIRLRADRGRVWVIGDDAQPGWVELSGNVTVETPEGVIRASRLEYDPATGAYTAPALSLRPVDHGG